MYELIIKPELVGLLLTMERYQKHTASEGMLRPLFDFHSKEE